MIKRIKIEKVWCFKDWAFKISEQTHREDKFGKDGLNYFQGSKKKLISASYPELYSGDGEDVLCVQGVAILKDNITLLATIKEMQDIELTIKEYNDFFGDGFKVEDKVWDVVRGEGEVINIFSESLCYPMDVKFIDRIYTYTYEGRYYKDDILPSLYKYPVEIVKKEQKND